MRGVKPPGGRWLRLYAVDIGRGPDGSWWALSDRAQAPSGCGYALENRLVVSQAFPDLYAHLNVERLAPFFRSLSAGLKSAGERAEPRIGIVTPGPLALTYFEQAYLARYLGFLLVEGEDLVVRDGRVFVRTIAGLKQCDVIWRHIDADWCDPLELNASSRIGVPGLLEALRKGGVAVENMPGTGLVELRAFLAFLPMLARRLMDQDLLIPNIATWWCGQTQERERVLDEFDRISIAAAFGNDLPGMGNQSGVITAEISASERNRLRDAISARGIDYVGQDIVRLSTTPRWTQGKLEPRPFVLRVYCTAAADGWRVMPGGFLPYFRSRRRTRCRNGRRRRICRCLGARRKSCRSLKPPSVSGKRPNYTSVGKPPKSCGGQSLLVRPLPRKSRSDVARRALSERTVRRSGRADAGWPPVARSSYGRSGWLGRDRSDDTCEGSSGGERAGSAQRRQLRLRVVARPFGPQRGFGYSREAYASDLGFDRPP